MIFGAITARGPIPQEGPLFMDEIKAEYLQSGGVLGKRGGINGTAYLWMIEHCFLPHVYALYPDIAPIWQGWKCHCEFSHSSFV